MHEFLDWHANEVGGLAQEGGTVIDEFLPPLQVSNESELFGSNVED